MAFKEIKQDRAKETRDRIILGAAETFAERGYAGASISSILEQAQTTKGALYFHFATKQEVAEAVLAADGQRYLDLWENHVTRTGLNGLIEYIHIHVRRRFEDPLAKAAARLFLDESFFHTQQADSYTSWVKWLVQILSEPESLDVLRDDVDIEALAQLISVTILGASASAEMWGADGVAPDLVSNWWRLLLPGIVKPECLGDIIIEPTEAVNEVAFNGELPERLAPMPKVEQEAPVGRQFPALGRSGLPSSFAAS